VANLKELDYPITSGKKLSKAGPTKVKGVGKGIAEVIDEYLEKGFIAKLNEFREGTC
jgi:DNA polymerase/3'-5' exonuclease PolX